MANLRLKKILLEVVDNQLNANDPPCTGEAYRRLQQAGYSKQEAKEKIGAVVLDQIYDTLKDGKSYDDDAYKAAMEEMVRQSIDFEDSYSLPSEWAELQRLIEAGYDAHMREQYPALVEWWTKAWEKCREAVALKPEKPTVDELDEESDYMLGLGNWLQDMEMELGNAGEEEKRLQFCQEVLATFDWHAGTDGGFRSAIGEALYQLGRKEEGQAWFEEWLQRTPHVMDAVNGYSWCLCNDGKEQEAYELLAQEIAGQPCTFENDLLFLRMQEVLQSLGKADEAAVYQKAYEEFVKHLEETGDVGELFDESGDWNEFDGFSGPDSLLSGSHETIVKPDKIYPNDPCPCGSGKKYKKCCGKR